MTPLERAANAVLYDLGQQMRESGETNFIEVEKVDAASIIRTVLQVLREPSEAMLLKGGYSGPWDSYAAPDDKDNARDVWRSMIDAALEEG